LHNSKQLIKPVEELGKKALHHPFKTLSITNFSTYRAKKTPPAPFLANLFIEHKEGIDWGLNANPRTHMKKNLPCVSTIAKKGVESIEKFLRHQGPLA